MPLGPFVEETDATARRQLEINVFGVEYGSKIALQRFLARGRGHLVNVASSAGKGGFPGGATYCGTKHCVVGLSEAIRAELRGTDVEITCVMPVLVNTELASGLPSARGVKNVSPEDVAAEIVDALKTPRFDVFVPRSVGTISKVMNVLPRGGREAVTRAMKADQVLNKPDAAKRLAYENRAAHAAPSLEAPDEQPSLTEGS